MSEIDRDDIVMQLRCGEITREEAEEWVKRNNQRLFVPDPPEATKYDPMRPPLWTLAMAAAWIVWRTEDAVRMYWDDYRLQCYKWYHVENIFVDGRKKTGWEPRRCTGASVHDVFREAADQDWNDSSLNALQCVDDLWNALIAGKIEGTGVPYFVDKTRSDMTCTSPKRVVIPRHEWADLSKIDYHDGLPDSIAAGLDDEPRYNAVRVWRDEVLQLWKTPAENSSIAAATHCRKWLVEQIRLSPLRRPKPKGQFKKEAANQFPGLSQNQFDAQWDAAILAEGAEKWRRAGRPKKSNQGAS